MKIQWSIILLIAVFVVLAIIAVFQNSLQTQQAEFAATQRVIQATQAGKNADSGRIYTDLLASEIGAIRIQSPLLGRSWLLNRDGNGDWTMPELELDGQLDQVGPEALAEGIAGLRFISKLDNVEADQYPDYGLKSENLILLIQILMPNGEGRSIAVGEFTPARDAFYVLVDDRKAVYVVSRQGNPLDFLIKSLLDNTQNPQ